MLKDQMQLSTSTSSQPTSNSTEITYSKCHIVGLKILRHIQK